jgi:hypothetical protein
MNTPAPLIDRASARDLLRIAVPEWQEFLHLLEDAKGRLTFRAGLGRAIKGLRIEDYPLLYEAEQSMGVALAKAFMSDEDLAELNAQLAQSSPEGRGAFAQQFGGELMSLLDAIEFPDETSPEEAAAARAAMEAVPADELAAGIRAIQLSLAGGLALFYEQLSILVHGEKLSSLVAQAKAGDDEAFAKAVQIDGRVLTSIPYFRDRHARARLEDDAAFLSKVWRRQVAAPYKGRIEHKALYLMFAFLDSVGLLKSFKHRELLDLYDELGVGSEGRRIEDEKNMGKRLTEYRRFQKRRHVSTP